MPPPTRQATSINALLNDDSEAPQLPHLILDRQKLSLLHEELVSRTSGCTIEQLEQLNAIMMDAVWRKRGEWNRGHVLLEVSSSFNAAIKDIEEVQGIGKPSQERLSRGGGVM